ncbi:hypothetical protein QBC38DRAFT_455499 [Podospora fimiseda]|uniref:Uncharacterized protein n=1 Tax=Podospora fimiseda TaxID=252190 RepID=A0AAN7BQ85_9PEZI|nr:hypothetical protein QBC38DRAFT_455499 [Podospora fimiseda]
MGASSPVREPECAPTPRSRSSSILSTIIVSDEAVFSDATYLQPQTPDRGFYARETSSSEDTAQEPLVDSSDDDDEDIPYRLPLPSPPHVLTPEPLPFRPNPVITLLPLNNSPLYGHHKIIDRFRLPAPISTNYYTNGGATENDRTSLKTFYYIINSKTGGRKMIPPRELLRYVTPRELERWEEELHELKKQSEQMDEAWRLEWEFEGATKRKPKSSRVTATRRETRSMRRSQLGLEA